MVGNLLKKTTGVLSLKQTNILSAAMIIMATILLSAALGFIKMRLLSNYFGDTRPLDIYLAAFRLPDIIYQLLVMGTVSSAFIPVFSGYLSRNEEKTAFFVSNTIISLSFLLFLGATFLIMLFTRQLSHLLAPGFSSGDLPLMVNLTRIMMAGQVFFIIGNFLTGMLQSYHRFLLPALAPVLYNVGIIIGTVFLSPFIGIYGPAYGVVIGTFLFFLIQYPFTVKMGWHYFFSLKLDHQGVREIIKLMLPRTLSLGVSQIEYTADLMIASLFAPGHYTVFTFALFLISFPVRLIGASIGQASLPTLSSTYAKDNLDDYKRTIIKSFQEIVYLILPAAIILLVLRVPLVRLAFGSRSFSWEATILTGRVVAYLTLAVIAQSLTQLLVRGFYALHDTKTPFMISALSVLVNVLMSLLFALYLKFGIVGLALSTSFASLLNMVLSIYYLKKKFGKIDDSAVISFGKKIFATGCMGMVLYFFMRTLDFFVFDTTKTLNLILLTVVTLILGTVSYLLISKVFQIEEADNYWQILRKMGQWRTLLVKSELVKTEEVIDQTSPAPQV